MISLICYVYKALGVKQAYDPNLILEKESITIIDSAKNPSSKQSVNTLTSMATSATMPDYTYRYVLRNYQYNSQTDNLIGNGQIIKYVVDTTFQLAIGTVTKHFWKVATILGISSSIFLPYGYAGDYLTHHYQTLQTYKDCQIYETGTGYWWTCATAEKKTIIDFVYLYSVDTNFNPVYYDNSSSSTYYSSRYSDDYFLYQKARYYYYEWLGMNTWLDYIP